MLSPRSHSSYLFFFSFLKLLIRLRSIPDKVFNFRYKRACSNQTKRIKYNSIDQKKEILHFFFFINKNWCAKYDRTNQKLEIELKHHFKEKGHVTIWSKLSSKKKSDQKNWITQQQKIITEQIKIKKIFFF